ncbi:hypothetical protein PS15m_011085 [Mucor circinelloides]
MKTKATPEKEILKKTSTSKVIQTLARKPQGPTSLPKPVTRGATAKRGTVPKEKTPDLADMSMNEDSPEADLITDDSAPAESLQPTDSPLVSQLSFAPAADTPEWVLTFQREFRAHEQRIASLEYAMAEIVRLKTELDATKTELGAANARVASLQKQILTRTDSGSNASKYASLPPTKQAATAVPPSAAPASEFPPLPSKPQSTSSTQKTVNTATTTKRKKKPLKTLLRIFEPPPMTDPSTLEGPQYMYVHVPNKYRTKLSKYRTTLRDVGFDTGRILDIHYPAKGVAALLIHTEYSTEVHELLEKIKIAPIADFDQFAAANLNDPAFADLSAFERAIKAREFQEVRLARGIQHARPYLRGAIDRDFVNQGFISDAQAKIILSGGSISASVDGVNVIDMGSQGTTSASSNDTESASSAGAGEPTNAQ